MVSRLREGGVILLPTDSGYALAADSAHARAVARLREALPEPQRPPLALALADAEDVEHHLRQITTTGRRLVERCWPGPVAMVFPDPPNRVEWGAIPKDVCEQLAVEKGICLRVPDHSVIPEAVEALHRPIVVLEVPPDGDTVPPRSAERLADLVLDDGPTRYPGPTSLVRIGASGMELLREGVASERRLRRLAGEVITFVCTGNSCRSPMAEAMFKRMLAERLSSEVEELPERGYTILSAGVAAHAGDSASEGARQAVREYGASLDEHISQPLSAELARLSDRLIAMTREHKNVLTRAWPAIADKVTLLCGDEDVLDPIGESRERYALTARQIHRALEKLLQEVLAETT